MTRELIITFSTVPPRFKHLHHMFDAILDQSQPADRIILYIPHEYRRFPDWDGVLPDVPEGVEIRRTDIDLGPATKVLAAARDFQGQDVDLLLCDDDRHYRRNWVEIFRRLRGEHPDKAICVIGRHAETMAESTGKDRFLPRAVRRWRITDIEFQAHFLFRQMLAGWNWRQVEPPHRRVFKRSGHIDIFEGCGGVLVKPEFFDEVAYEIPPVLWSVDDVWLSGMVTRLGVPIWLHANLKDPYESEANDHNPLVHSVIDGADRETANRMAVEYMQENYGIWL